MHRKKKILIITMCVAIFLMAVGYAAFSTNLKINGTASVTSTWQILFTKIEEVSKTDGVTIISNPTANGTTATFNVGLELPGDSIEYKITVENQGTVDAIINDIVASELGSDAIEFEVSDIKEGDILREETSTTFNITISYDESVTSQPILTDNELSITINYMQYTGQSITSTTPTVEVLRLSQKILQDNVAQSDTSIDFSKTSEEDGTKGLYYTSTNTEDNKTTYYFRGAVEKNYVKFGKREGCGYKGEEVLHIIDVANSTFSMSPTEEECLSTIVCDAGTIVKDNYGADYRYMVGLDAGTCSYLGGTALEEKATYGNIVDMYWRIIRINEDGSVRMILKNPIGRSEFNANADDNAYVGYMYGTAESSTYAATHANTNDSTIKDYLDDWYVDNLSSYSDMMADAGFCNDRSIANDSNVWHSNDTALGYGKNHTYYGAWSRLMSSTSSMIKEAAQPRFSCPNEENDLFTTSTSSKGNKALDYPVGLITIDEFWYAGGTYHVDNSTYYLNNLTDLTMSPFHFDSTSSLAFVWDAFSDGSLFSGNSVYYGRYVRPVINLKYTVEIESGGAGTATNPYIIKTN